MAHRQPTQRRWSLGREDEEEEEEVGEEEEEEE
jgi:hypothetical protein